MENTGGWQGVIGAPLDSVGVLVAQWEVIRTQWQVIGDKCGLHGGHWNSVEVSGTQWGVFGIQRGSV